jgi:hypothetical protein
MSAMSESTHEARAPGYRLGEVTCEECGERAPLFAAGWRASGPSDSYSDELSALVFHCPGCAAPDPDAN